MFEPITINLLYTARIIRHYLFQSKGLNFACFRTLVILFLSVFFCFSFKLDGAVPTAHNGVLDLRDYDFAENGPVKLDGEWELYWSKFIRPESFDTDSPPLPDDYYIVPGNWSNTRDGSVFPAHGHASCRLRIILPESYYRYGLMVNAVDTAYIMSLKFSEKPLFVVRKGEVGTSAETAVPEVVRDVFFFNTAGDELEILFNISNFGERSGGFWNSVALGTDEQIKRERTIDVSKDMFLFGALLIIGLYFVAIYFYNYREYSSFVFGVFCLILALYTIGVNSKLAVYFLKLNFEMDMKLQYFAFYTAIPVFIHFVTLMFPRESYKYGYHIAYAIAAVFILPVFVTRLESYSQAINVYIFLTGLAVIYTLYIAIRALIHRRFGGWLFAAAFVVLALAMINDVISSRFIYTFPKVAPFGVLIFIFLQSVMLASKLSHALKVKEELITIEEDIAIAKRIQESTLAFEQPESSYYKLASTYMPMLEIGGDFYGFHVTEDEGLGIFLADVTGHGIHAALVASMVKVIFTSLEHLATEPVKFLSGFNEMMLNNADTPLLTAGYIFLDPLNKKISFVRAGHEPLLIYSRSKDEFTSLLPRGRLVGFKEELNLEPAEHRVDYGDRLVLYTDGIIECRSPDGVEYGSDNFKAFIITHADTTPEQFIENLKEELYRWKKSDEQFEDDITLIVLDIQ